MGLLRSSHNLCLSNYSLVSVSVLWVELCALHPNSFG